MRFILIASCLCFTLIGCQKSSIAVVDINQLFDEFSYTKEMREEFVEKTKSEKASLDLLYQELSQLEQAKSSVNSEELNEQFVIKRQEFQSRYDRFEAYQKKLTEDSDEKILVQLNQYIKDYALSKNLELVLSNGQDDISVVYASEDYNKTDEVLKFINQKYEGE